MLRAGEVAPDLVAAVHQAGELLRAARVVTDTGIHAMGWSREQAYSYMLETVGPYWTHEVDRYIAWPGQALAYQVGNLELRRLRMHAETRLGGEFRLRGFHDAVLAAGAAQLRSMA